MREIDYSQLAVTTSLGPIHKVTSGPVATSKRNHKRKRKCAALRAPARRIPELHKGTYRHSRRYIVPNKQILTSAIFAKGDICTIKAQFDSSLCRAETGAYRVAHSRCENPVAGCKLPHNSQAMPTDNQWVRLAFITSYLLQCCSLLELFAARENVMGT